MASVRDKATAYWSPTTSLKPFQQLAQRVLLPVLQKAERIAFPRMEGKATSLKKISCSVLNETG